MSKSGSTSGFSQDQDLTEYARARRIARALTLRNAHLEGADLSGLRGDGLDLARARLDHANLHGARLGGCSFERASLNGADLTAAVLRNCRFDGASLRHAQLAQAKLEDSAAAGADLSNANLTATHLTETSLMRAVLRGAVLDEAEGAGASFRGADLADASCRKARLREADFRGADLTGADLSGAALTGADFRGAILDNVVWNDATCHGARFDPGHERATAEGTPRHPSATPASTAVADAVDAVGELLRAAVRDPRLGALVSRIEAPAGKAGAGSAADFRALLDTLRAELAGRDVDASAILRPFEQLLTALESASGDEPPEAMKQWLEPLMKMGNGDQPFDLKAVLDALSALAQAQPPGKGGAPRS